MQEPPVWQRPVLHRPKDSVRQFLLCPDSSKEVALDPKINDWILTPRENRDNVCCYVLDSPGNPDTVKPRYAHLVLDSKKAVKISDADRLAFLKTPQP
mgnify:CR=1 FL=1